MRMKNDEQHYTSKRKLTIKRIIMFEVCVVYKVGDAILQKYKLNKNVNKVSDASFDE